MDRGLLSNLTVVDLMVSESTSPGFSAGLFFSLGGCFFLASCFGLGSSSFMTGCSRATDFILNSPRKRGLHAASKSSRSTEYWSPSEVITLTPLHWSPRPREKPNPIESISTFSPVLLETFSIRFSFTESRSICVRMMVMTKIREKDTHIQRFNEDLEGVLDILSLEESKGMKILKLSGHLPIPE